ALGRDHVGAPAHATAAPAGAIPLAGPGADRAVSGAAPAGTHAAVDRVAIEAATDVAGTGQRSVPGVAEHARVARLLDRLLAAQLRVAHLALVERHRAGLVGRRVVVRGGVGAGRRVLLRRQIEAALWVVVRLTR